MRVGRDLNVKVVNGVMFRLLNAKSAFTLTHILSPHFALLCLRQRLYASRKLRRAGNVKSSYPRTYGLIGLRTAYAHPGWANSTTLRELRQLRAQVGMLPNIYSNPRFSRVIGLPDGSVLGILRPFPIRLKQPPTQLFCYLTRTGLHSPLK